MKLLMMHIIMGMMPLISTLDNNAYFQKKARVRLRLEYFNISGSEYLTIKVTGRLEKKYKPLEEMGVSIYLSEQTKSGLIGKVITDASGVATLQLVEKYRAVSDTLFEMSFIAVLDTNPIYQNKETNLTIRKAILKTSFTDYDSLKLIQANVAEDSRSGRIPQENVEIKFFVDRPLSRLPIGELYNATNEEGKVSVIFPADLPGDSSGNVKIFVRIDDSDIYGNVEISEILPWGVPTQYSDATIARSLWASGANAPILLLLLVNVLIVATWVTLFYIVYKVYQISKI